MPACHRNGMGTGAWPMQFTIPLAPIQARLGQTVWR